LVGDWPAATSLKLILISAPEADTASARHNPKNDFRIAGSLTKKRPGDKQLRPAESW
jgi:hypothetical protein